MVFHSEFHLILDFYTLNLNVNRKAKLHTMGEQLAFLFKMGKLI